MAIPNKQIGGSEKYNLLWQISKQLEELINVAASGNIITTTTTTTAVPSVLIGTQRWVIKNLDVPTYRDGTPIPQVTDPTQWAALTTGAWCHYNNDPANDAIYGKLYNWYAVNNIINGGLAPVGQHIPTNTEFITLTTFLGGEVVAGGKMKSTGTIPAGTGLWASPNVEATNESGFTGFPGGYCAEDGIFGSIGGVGNWWSSSENDLTDAWCRIIRNSNGNAERAIRNKKAGFSVRCIID